MSAFVDVAIVLAVLGAARSGWRRGLVFYLIDLVGFAVAVFAAVRFHDVPAAVLEAFLSRRTSAIVGGLVIFVPLIVLTAIVGSKASRAMFRPGLFTTNRVLGAALGAALATAIIVVGLFFARAAKLPLGIGDLVNRSAIATRVVDGTAPAVAWADEHLGLDLCGGRLERTAPELCKKR